MMAKFRKKPVVIEAMQYRGDNAAEVLAWANAECVAYQPTSSTLTVKTLEGEMTVYPLSWLIRGVQGELYPCKPDIFAATYEPAE
jgi:hypothetical protein